MRKCVTPIIAIVLLTLITVGAVGVAFFWVSNIQSSLQESVGGAVGSAPGVDCSRLSIVSMQGDKLTVSNTGCDTIENVTVVVDGVLTEYVLDEPLSPGEAGTITFTEPMSAGSEHCVTITLPTGQLVTECVSSSEASEEAGFSAECGVDGDCDDNNVCTSNICSDGFCTYPALSDGQRTGCTDSTGCSGTGDVVCACLSGDCSDSCGDGTCQDWETETSCSIDCAACEESVCDNPYTMFSGTITSDDLTICPCCGDDNSTDIFYNNSHMCSYGGVIFDEDNLYVEDEYADRVGYASGKGVCELNDYVWFGSMGMDNWLGNITVGSVLYDINSIKIADFDNDDWIDFVVGDESDNVIKVFRNDGTPFDSEWERNSLVSSGTNVRSVGVADFDNDGFVDVVSGHTNGSINVWRNDGSPFSGEWSSNNIGRLGSDCYDIALADFDNDGFVDILTKDYYGGLVVWRNDGSPFSGEWSNNSVASCDSGYSVADFDNDGFVDIFLGDNGGESVVLRNDGTPFSGSWSINSVGRNVESTSVGDFNRNGLIDLVANDGSNLYVFRNDGTPFSGSWFENNVGQTNSSVVDLSLGDVDNDGFLDFLSLVSSGEIDIFRNDGSPFSGEWSNISIYNNFSFNSVSIEAGDFDNDGDLDVLAGSLVLGTNSLIKIFKNHGINGGNGPCCGDDSSVEDFWNSSLYCYQGSIFSDLDSSTGLCNSKGSIYFSGSLSGSNGPCCGDDGSSDVFYNSSYLCSYGGLVFDEDALYTEDKYGDNINYSSGKGVCELKGNTWMEGNISLRDAAQYFAGDDPIDIALGDLNNDEILDIVATNEGIDNVSILLGVGDGTFGSNTTLATGETPLSVALGDLNNDGDLDIITANKYSHDVSVFLGNGDGTFASNVSYFLYKNGFDSVQPTDVTLGDVDNDGDLDIVVASGEFNYDFGVLLGVGDGTFGNVTYYGAGNWPKKISLGDVDNDGNLDALIQHGWSNKIGLIFGYGNGEFGEFRTIHDEKKFFDSTLGDLNNDGNLDIIYYSYDDEIDAFLGYGNGSFYDSNNPFIKNYINYLKVGDMDNDGNIDVVLTSNYNDEVSILLGGGDGSFVNIISFPADTPGEIALGDLENDGDIDIVVSNGSHPTYYFNSLLNELISGNNGPCCGDDGADDDFWNSSHYCVDGSIEDSCGDGTCQSWESSSTCSDDCNAWQLLRYDSNNTGYSYEVTFPEQSGIFEVKNFTDVDYSGYSGRSSSPRVAELSGDDYPDIVLFSGHTGLKSYYGNNDSLYWENDSISSSAIDNTIFSEAPIALGDIDNDGLNEVVVYGNVGVYVFNNDGSYKWFTSFDGNSSTNNLQIRDLDNNNINDILIGFTYSSGDYTSLTALKGSDGSIIWEYHPNDGEHNYEMYSTPAVADIDNDGQVEVIFGSDYNKIHCLSGNNGDEEWVFNTNDVVRSSPGINDLNDDGYPDVIFGCNDSKVYAVSGSDHSEIWNYPVSEGVPERNIALGDVDNDDSMDVVFVSSDDKVRAINDLGNLLWDHQLSNVRTGINQCSSPSIGDVDGDGVNEIIVSFVEESSEDIRVVILDGETGLEEDNILYQHSGAGISGIYQPGDSINLADVDGDGVVEIIFSASNLV